MHGLAFALHFLQLQGVKDEKVCRIVPFLLFVLNFFRQRSMALYGYQSAWMYGVVGFGSIRYRSGGLDMGTKRGTLAVYANISQFERSRIQSVRIQWNGADWIHK